MRLRLTRRLPAAALLALAFVGSAIPAAAQPAPAAEGRYVFRTYAEEDGLGNLTVECLLQDRVGFLWIGTQDGLFRFDGSRFLRFGREEGLPSTRINSLHETEEGRLYVGTRSGLARSVGEKFETLGAAAGLPDSAIPDQGIASSRGTVFVAMPSGLYVGSSDRFRLEPRGGGAAEDPVTGVHVAADGSLFFARRALLYRRAAGASEEFGRSRGLPDVETIDETVTDGEGTLWVRTLKKLYRLRRGEEQFADASEGLPDAVASGRLALDDQGRLLVPTQRGLARPAASGWSLLGRSRGLESDTVLSALVDREGSLWVGLAGVGLAQQLGRGIFTSWGAAEGLPHDVVWSAVREKLTSGALWIGTQEGVARVDPAGGVEIFQEPDRLGGNTVYALAATADGSVWAGSWPGGVTRFGPERGQIRRYAASDLPAAEFRIAALHVDRAGNLLAGARSGLYRLDLSGAAAAFVKLPPAPGGDEPDSIYGIAQDAAGRIFAAGRFGIQVFGVAGEAPRRFRKTDGLKADFLASLVVEPGGSFVAGYREALGAERISFPRGSFSHQPLDRAAGLTADKVILLGRDFRGNLWIGSGSGVDVWRPGEVRPAHYGRSSGLISEDLDQNAFFAEPDGTVWLGTSRGLVRYFPGAESAAVPPPPILLTEVEAGRQRLDSSGKILHRIGREDRSVRIAWAGLTFMDPRKVRYRYRLAGLDESFTETALTEARFPALPTGKYRFEVAAISSTGRESERPALFSFEVLPAWWERWWARAAAAALVGLLVLAVVRLRTRALEADRRRLEEAVAARSSELAAANRELEEASMTDPLTKLRNRRYFSLVVDEDARRAQRAYHLLPGVGTPDHRDVVFYLIDLDHFKEVNDSYGHEAGDRVLTEVAARLRRVARQSDLIVRWGGEEFLIVSRDAERRDGRILAERLLEALAAERFDVGEGRSVRLTGSVGWAPYPWDVSDPHSSSYEEVLRLADRALYAAKAGGRNRSVAAKTADAQEQAADRDGALPYRLETSPGPDHTPVS